MAGLFVYLHFTGDDRDGPDAGAQRDTTTNHPTTTSATAALEDTIPQQSAGAHAAEDAARQGLTVAFTWNPATDGSPSDAYARARPWFTEVFAARTIIDGGPERGPGIQWDQWASQGAKVVADVDLGCSGCPPDSETVVHRVATISQTAIVGEQTEEVTPDTTVWITLIRTIERWLIDDIRY
ncbi:hypothetical protein [Rhodococcus pseudokoreensis]|nr:hypothetical protein [Rhodococcus pseudokoreensis]